MKDEGFLSPAGKRLVALGVLLAIVAVAAYALLAEDISIDLDELTGTSTTSTTEVDLETPDITIPEPLDTPYFRCLENAQTADEVFDCGKD